MSFNTNKPMIEGAPHMTANGPMASGSDSPSPINLQVMRSVRMRPVLAGCVAGIVLLAMIGYASLQKSIYSATSQLYVTPTGVKVLGDGTPANFDEGQYESFLSEQLLLVTRPDVLKAALDSVPAEDWAQFGGSEQEAVGNLTTQLKVQRVGTSRQVSIGLKGTDAAKVAAIVNAVTSAYLDAAHKATTAESDQREQLLAEERQRIAGALETERAEQIALGASIGVANPSVEGGNPYDAELSGLRVQLSEARAAHEVAAAQLASLSGLGPTGASGLMAAADEQIMGDAGLGSMKASISQRKAQLTAQMAGMTPTNPVYKQAQDEIADLDRTLDKMTVDLRDKAARRLQDKLHSDLQRTGDVESRLNGQLARQIANATSAAPRLQRASEVAADIQRLNIRLASVDDALRNIHMEVSGPAHVRLSIPATPADHPEANRKKQFLLLALPLALLFGVGGAVLARLQDKRICLGLDAKDVLGFAPMAVLPARADVSQRVFEEYVLRLAAGIESAYRNSGARTFLLTAVSLTTDIRPLASALTRKFEEIGVNVIVATASEMLAPTDGNQQHASDLSAMDADQIARVVDLWSEGFVAANVAKMKTEHGLVLIESEALLNCAQTEYVARCADATILMIECGVTTRQELMQAMDLLHRLNVTGIGAVLEEVQLQYADAPFRKAIESLDRRQAEPARKDFRQQGEKPVAAVAPVPVIAPIAPATASAFVEGGLDALATEPLTGFEPKAESEIVEHEVFEPKAVDFQKAEAPTVADAKSAEVADKLSHFEELLHHVRATPPARQDSGWNLPMFDQVETTSTETDEAKELADRKRVLWDAQESFATGTHPLTQMVSGSVENSALTSFYEPEKPVVRSSVDIQSTASHENIAPMLSARREESASNGDLVMTRKSSWFDKLLRRDSESIVSIVPTRDDEDDDIPVPGPVASTASKADDTKAVASASPAAADASYDAPLAARLDQASRQRPIATGASNVASISSGMRPSSRLQILPPEPVEPEPVEPEQVEHRTVVSATAPDAPVFSHVDANVYVPVHAPEPIAEVVDAAEQGMTSPVEPETVVTTPEPAAALETTAPVVEPAFVPAVVELPKAMSPRRPLTFQQLAGMVELRDPASASAALVAKDAVVQAPVDAEPTHPDVEVSNEVIAAERQPFEVATPAVASESVPEAVAPMSEAVEPESAPVEWTPAEPLAEQSGIHAAEPDVAAGNMTDADQSWALKPSHAASDESPEPHRSSSFDSDDIEPVYREASRSLNHSRWDPIPQLRPSAISWRDRPSPVPLNGHGAGHHVSDQPIEDAFSQTTPPRWIPEDEPVVAAEPVVEPLLSRQWGLLSRFQQQRLVSPASGVGELAGNGDGGADNAGSSHGAR